jgi:hypothetical protein
MRKRFIDNSNHQLAQRTANADTNQYKAVA